MQFRSTKKKRTVSTNKQTDAKEATIHIPYETTNVDFQQELLAIVESSPNCIAISDKNGNILYQNPSKLQALGIYDEKQDPLTDAHLTHHLFTTEKISIALKDGIWRGETTYLQPDKTEVTISQTIVPHKSLQGEVEFLSFNSSNTSKKIELKKVNDSQVLYDSLTTLPNRHYLNKKLSETLTNSTPEKKFALLFIDLDNFKAVNDTYGNQIGDLVLEFVALNLKNHLHNAHFISRYSDDKFVVVVENIHSLEHLKLIIDKIAEAFLLPFHFESNHIHLSGSVSFSIYPDHGKDTESLLKKAIQVMRSIKNTKKGKFNK